MDIQEIEKHINGYARRGLKLFTTSSFQSHSLVLLHILSKIDPGIPVVFINTGYHFPETITFRDHMVEQFGLVNLIDLRPEIPKVMQKAVNGRLMFAVDPDYCCYLNKTQPLEVVLQSHDVWINGIRADQGSIRQAMKLEQPAPFGTLRFHPMLDWTSKMIVDYRKKYKLPTHPLEARGYLSIGCEPCTRKSNLEMDERESRWYGLQKLECGLHTDLVE